MRPQATRTGLFKLAVAPIVAIGTVVLAAPPASAAATATTYTFEFAPPGGTFTSCTITVQGEFPFNGANGARAVTTTSGSSPACTQGVSTVAGAEYRNTAGDLITSPYTGTYGPSHQATYTGVARDLNTYHQVYFPACGCATDIYTLSVPNPK